MSDDADSTDNESKQKVVRFPQSRVSPAGKEPFQELGSGLLSKTLGQPAEQATGHWCRYCRGIWYGFLLEVTCPRCGNRHG